MSLKLYEVDNNYIDYLKKFDNKVLHHSNPSYNHTRKYLGILFNINEFKYIAPLSSPKQSDYDSDGKIRSSSKIIIRIIKKQRNNMEELLGTIKLCNMIPICNSKVINEYNLKSETDSRYKNLVQDQLTFINSERHLIIKRAEKLYKKKVKNSPYYLQNTVDFLLLEKKAKKYRI